MLIIRSLLEYSKDLVPWVGILVGKLLLSLVIIVINVAYTPRIAEFTEVQ